ncbi:multidrug resistance efflux transporter family protein [Planococcus salinus]|uniref:Multidrug resistance efflux transporter family protein n=1 Tax=Planococcus salinus TaxID=1848460 RepID=A0A3M8P3I1_9BACL|nr:multidrug resistance efflux transporter family protein [Planococcus salinus]RNF38269.1 multidrug resistance efflux transporter family protein [Planococcus salinus]
MRPIVIGILAAFFFAVTFVLNAAMEASGGSWIWSASLRYIFMVPFLVIIVLARKNMGPLLKEMKKNPGTWLLWSFVGFGLFYAPLCYAAAYSPGWLIAGTWQFTIIAGTLLAPLFLVKKQTSQGPVLQRGKIPLKGLGISLIILVGIVLMQLQHASSLPTGVLLLGVLPVILAAFAYPLGNRKMMDSCEGRLDAYQRVLGMTLASLPFWLLLSIYGLFTVGPPSIEQSFQTLVVAVCSGIIATVLFFKATDMVRGDMQKLGSVEATQSMEVIFALAGEMLILSIAFPSPLSWLGVFIIIIGMALHSHLSNQKPVPAVHQSVKA